MIAPAGPELLGVLLVVRERHSGRSCPARVHRGQGHRSLRRGRYLTVRGERPARERASGDGFEHIERAAGTFLRRFTMPDSARAEAIKARYVDGVLEIEIPKQPRVETKRISVTVN